MRQGRNRLRSLVAAVALIASTGCWDSGPTLVKVSGRVTIDGKPVTTGAVRFTPLQGRLSGGPLGQDGRFELTCFESGDGAMPGKHLVTVYAAEPLGETAIRWHAPKKYSKPTTSGIEITIDEPTEDIEIELTWGGQKGPYVERD
ncbi:MAG: hypothetical protein AAGJ46_08910 [Planctomycetota bacterium]